MARLAWLFVLGAPAMAACSILNSPDEVQSAIPSGGQGATSSSTGNPDGGAGGTGGSTSSVGGAGGQGGGPPAVCGNGMLEGDEACDDGNDETGDACSPACVITQFDVEVDPTIGNEFPGVGTSGVDGGKGFYVAWRWLGGTPSEIRGRAFTAKGKRVGANPTKLSNAAPGQARIGTNPEGRSIVAWSQFDAPNKIAYRIIEPNGTPGNPTEGTLTDNSSAPAGSLVSVGASGDGRFLLAWYQYNAVSGFNEARARAFDSDGSSFLTSSQTLGVTNGYFSAGAWGLGTGFIASYDSTTGGLESWLLNDNGVPQSPPGAFGLADDTGTLPQGSYVGPGNQFIAVYEKYVDIGGVGKTRVLKRPFDDAADPGDLSTLVSSEHREERDSRVARSDSGRFIVVWSDRDPIDSQPESLYRIMARLFLPNGNAAGPEFQVSEDVKGRMSWPGVAVNADGDAMIVWDNWDGDAPVPSGQNPFKISGKIYPRLLAQ